MISRGQQALEDGQKAKLQCIQVSIYLPAWESPLLETIGHNEYGQLCDKQIDSNHLSRASPQQAHA